MQRRTVAELEARLAHAEAERDELRRAAQRLAVAWSAEAVDFRLVFDALPGQYLVVTPDLTLVAISDELRAATMLARDDALGRYLFDVLPDNPDDPAGAGAWRRSLLKVVETKQADVMPVTRYSIRRPESEGGGLVEKFWRPSNHPVLGPDGEVVYILHRTEDVTVKHRAESALADAREQIDEQARELAERTAFLENIIYNTPAAIAYLDRELVIRMSNQANASFLGIPNDQILGRHLLGVMPGGGKQLEGLFRKVLETKVPYTATEYQVTYRRPDGTERTTYWDFGYYPVVLHAGGDAVGVLSVSQEVSARVAHDRERERALLSAERVRVLEEAEKLKDQFLGILSHELRTPINAILGFGSVLADGLAGELTPDQAKHVGKILDSSDLLLGLVDDLLDMSRVQAGKFALDVQVVELAPLIRNAVANLAVDAIRKGLSLVNEVPASLPTIKADPRRVSQVLTNLVTNAIKYTPEGGAIRLRAGVEDEAVRVEVCDTGIGVPPEQQARIFQAFTQVDMSNTRKAGGVGLGLSIVKALVEAHGGEVGVESEGEGRGSAFWFTVPLVSG